MSGCSKPCRAGLEEPMALETLLSRPQRTATFRRRQSICCLKLNGSLPPFLPKSTKCKTEHRCIQLLRQTSQPKKNRAASASGVVRRGDAVFRSGASPPELISGCSRCRRRGRGRPSSPTGRPRRPWRCRSCGRRRRCISASSAACST